METRRAKVSIPELIEKLIFPVTCHHFGDPDVFGIRGSGAAAGSTPLPSSVHEETDSRQPQNIADPRKDFLDPGVCHVFPQGRYFAPDLTQLPGNLRLVPVEHCGKLSTVRRGGRDLRGSLRCRSPGWDRLVLRPERRSIDPCRTEGRHENEGGQNDEEKSVDAIGHDYSPRSLFLRMNELLCPMEALITMVRSSFFGMGNVHFPSLSVTPSATF